jgi:GT2 family glycosyltransferase
VNRQESQPDVSILIISFNTQALLRECLQSVRNFSVGLDVETIVVDNASRDGSPAMVEAEFPEVLLVRSDVNLGFGVANNVGLEKARGRYIVLLNSDAFLREDTLRLSVSLMEQHPGCGVGGAKQVGRNGEYQPSARRFPNLRDELLILLGLAAKYPKSKFFGRFDRTWASPDEPCETDWVPGAFAIIRREALQAVGAFDPRFFLYYEEVDLFKRIQQAGFKILYWPQIVVTHIGGESSRSVKQQDFSETGAQVTVWRMRSTLLYYRKHHGQQALWRKWLENSINRISALKNARSSDPSRQIKGRRSQRMVEMMNQAWRETRGGRVSPPVPW